MESCPFKQPWQSEKGESGKRRGDTVRRERGWRVCVCVQVFIHGFREWGVTSWEAPHELRNGVSLLISKLKHVPRWGRFQMSDCCEAARHQRGILLIFLAFKWVSPAHCDSLGCVREKWENNMFFSLSRELSGKDRERCLCRHYQELTGFIQLIQEVNSTDWLNTGHQYFSHSAEILIKTKKQKVSHFGCITFHDLSFTLLSSQIEI